TANNFKRLMMKTQNLRAKIYACGAAVLLFLQSCTHGKIANVAEARNFLFTHSWTDSHAKYWDDDGNKFQSPMSVKFTQTDVLFNKKRGVYKVERKDGGKGQWSDKPYYIASWYDLYLDDFVNFYLSEDGFASLQNERRSGKMVSMTFDENQ